MSVLFSIKPFKLYVTVIFLQGKVYRHKNEEMFRRGNKISFVSIFQCI